MRVHFIITLIFAASLLMLCAPTDEFAEQVEEPQVTHAVAVIHPTEGNDVQGIVEFRRMDSGVQVSVNIDGLTQGEHGFHIHEYGDCSAADATSAGGHYNPTDMPHGAPQDKERHVGDLGNIVADADGHAESQFTDATIQLNGAHSIIGRAVVIHAGRDDLTTQPSGAAGPRVACGVIGIAK